jgi:hypothetical protein
MNCSAGAKSTFGVPEGSRDLVIGALSEDGSRIFWTNSGGNLGRLYERRNPTQPQSALAHGEASGAGKRTSGSNEVTEVSTAQGAFAVGQRVSGQGIPFGATIATVGVETLTLSANATKSTAKTAELLASSECTEVGKACTLGISEAVEGSVNENGSQFWAASPDGAGVLFGSGSVGSEKPQKLYLYDVASATPTLIAGETLGVLGQSEDLSLVYFLSREALNGKTEGEEAGKPNLYLYEAGEEGEEAESVFIATLSARDAEFDSELPAPVHLQPYLHTSRVSADGELLAFMSTAPLAGYDNTDRESGEADAEVYLYQAALGRLICASCDPGGARPAGADIGPLTSETQSFWAAAKLPFIGNELYFSHVLSEDGTRLFFESLGPLVPTDTNGAIDVYEWEELESGSCKESNPAFSPQNEGCIFLISSGEDPHNSELLDASPEGKDVFIRTGASLVAQDPGQFDVYDARIEGGFPPPAEPKPPCEGEACQSPPPPPAEITPASSAFKGPENPQHRKARCNKNQRRVVKGGKARCVKKQKRQNRRAQNNRRAGR